MKLDTEFIRLPLQFDAEKLAEEVLAFKESEWKVHPQGFAGNSALLFVSLHGDPFNDSTKGPMEPTPYLDRCPYLKQVFASFQANIGRSRLMRIAGDSQVSAHVDMSYYWVDRVRIHVPILTYPEVTFYCGDKTLNMKPGECWIFNTWMMHNVINGTEKPRIHLVADTVGSPHFWNLVDQGYRPFAENTRQSTFQEQFVPFDPNKKPELHFEYANFPTVMTPWEQELLLQRIRREIAEVPGQDQKLADELFANVLRPFQMSWRELWARFADREEGFSHYEKLVLPLAEQVQEYKGKLRLSNGSDIWSTIRSWITGPAVDREIPKLNRRTLPEEIKVEAQKSATVTFPASPKSPEKKKLQKDPRFDRPIIIVAAPRSGSTFLFETLALAPDLYTIGGESHQVFEQFHRWQPSHRNFSSNRLTEVDAFDDIPQRLRDSFYGKLRNREGQQPSEKDVPLRFLEKTPKNALRIPLLNAIFPDAYFIYLYRNPQENVSSIIDAWKSGGFVTYRKLPGWEGDPWSLLLIPGWEQLNGKPIGEIAARQWQVTHEIIMADLQKIPGERWISADYANLVGNTQAEMERLCSFVGLKWDQQVQQESLPLSKHTLTAPDPNKWRKNESLLTPVMDELNQAAESIQNFLKEKDSAKSPNNTIETIAATPVSTMTQPKKEDIVNETNPTAKPTSAKEAKRDVASEPLKCVNTSNFASILSQLGVSLLVTTYQAGKLIIVRAEDQNLNVHFHNFPMPMGLAVDGRRMVLGTKTVVREYINQPEVARKIEPAGKYDGCFLPRDSHTTGDIRIHELGIGNDELWIVNTRFSCLCTLDKRHSFVPRWRPKFVSKLAAEDRCHVNGLAMIDQRPKYVTALGTTDTEGGWRENKANGGVLIDIETDEIILKGLSMPHSPRWYRNEMWVLESGDGNLSRVDLARKTHTPVAHVPGFTRGIDFCQNLAFIGLSQVRESAIFSGIPITERLKERTCGVWVVDINTGKTVAFLRFDSGVQEIFAVQVLPRLRYPELLKDDDPLLANAFMLPQDAMSDVFIKAAS